MKLLKCILSFSVLSLALPCHTQMGCMDTSWHLEQPFDNKALHPVECTCPCHRYESDFKRPLAQNRCPKCRHIRIPESPIIITKEDLLTNPPATEKVTTKSSLQAIYMGMKQFRSSYK